ncbi:MAG: hypothetical protein HY001_02200 [Candidatus Portnoybacteria bacterium]|nr:hypothetical protein [Candidatus Portnoybacteria bacterium]
MAYKKIEKSWVVVDGRLEDIDYKGEAHFRFPEEVAELVINTYSKKGDWILDPFAGFGTTLHVAQRLGRKAIGFETDTGRAEFANKGLKKPNKVITARSEIMNPEKLPPFNLVFTSPHYITLRLEDDPHGETYFDDIKTIFQKITKVLAPEAAIVVEISNIRDANGVRPLAWQIGELLSSIFVFQGEVIRCNKSKIQAGPGFDHSYLLVFKEKSWERRSR